MSEDGRGKMIRFNFIMPLKGGGYDYAKHAIIEHHYRNNWRKSEHGNPRIILYRVMLMRLKGKTYAQIGAAIGVGHSRARQILRQQGRIINRKYFSWPSDIPTKRKDDSPSHAENRDRTHLNLLKD